MNILVRKMSKFGILKLQLVIGCLIMLAAMIAFPLAMLSFNAELMKNPYILGTAAIVMLIFGSAGSFCFVRPYILYRKFPVVQAETDGEFLYIHTKKEEKIPLADIKDAYVWVELPYLYQKEFIAEFLIHLFSEEYGDVVVEIPGYGKYKMRFVAHARAVAGDLTSLFNGLKNS